MVDNCYGEFVERIEPSDLGADMVVGSLIKNPGGGLAPIGAISPEPDSASKCSVPLGSPGLGREVGASLGVNQSFFQGLFLAPTVVSGALKELSLRQTSMSAWALMWFQTARSRAMISFRRSRLENRRVLLRSARAFRRRRRLTAMYRRNRGICRGMIPRLLWQQVPLSRDPR